MRRILRWSYFLMALAAVAALVVVSRHSKNLTPREHYEAGRRYAFGPDRDADLAFRHLDFALRGAEAADNTTLTVEILKARGRLFTALGSLLRARQDYEEILRRHLPDDTESQLALASVLLALEQDAEASRRIDAVLEAEPDSGPALAVRAELDLRYARAALTEARRLIEMSLPPSARNEAMESIVRASTLPVQDKARLRQVDALRRLFPGNDERLVQSVLTCLETATERNAAARAALQASFSQGATTTTLDAFLDLLARSRRGALAIDFAMAALQHPGVRPGPAFLERTAELLEGNGQPHLALEVISTHLGGNMPTPAFYERWCRLLYEAQRWEDLVIVASAFAQAGSTTQILQGFGYLGLAKARLGELEEAQKALRPFLNREPPEPFPGAIAQGWKELALLYREAGRDTEEAGALRLAIAKGRGLLQGEGELWLRMYELGSAAPASTRNNAELERTLTFALSLLPERVEEFLPAWHELGRRNLDAARIDLRAVFEEMVQTQTFTPPTSAGPYEIFELAQLFAARELHAGVLQCTNVLLVQYPGFLPAEDLALASRRALDDRQGIARILQARLGRPGAGSRVVAEIEALGARFIDPDQRLQLMRLDPAGYARRAMLAALLEHGETALMVDSLLALPDEQLSDEDRLQGAELLLELGHGDELAVLLDELGPDPLLQARGAGLRLRAALAVEDWDSFDERLAAIRSDGERDAVTLRRCLDDLLSLGQARRALELGLWIDAEAPLRTPTAVLRTSQAARRLGERRVSEEGLSRADAALSDGAPELGFVLDAVFEGDWGRLPERVGDLRASGFVPSDLGSAILEILGEDPARAAERVSAGVARQPYEPLWLLARAALAERMSVRLDAAVLPGASADVDHQTVLALRGSDARPRDAREILALVLAAEHVNWRDWALAECTERAQEAALWHGYIAARAWLRRGDPSRARARAEELAAAWPHFPALWDLLEMADAAEVQRLQGSPVDVPVDQPSLVRWRQREVLGTMPGDPAREHWMASLEAERNGERETALAAATRAVDLAPADVRYRLTQARLYAAGRDWLPALSTLDQAIRLADAESRLTVAERALELQRAILAEAPAASLLELVRDQRERLELRFPTDPLVSIDLARTDLSNWSSSPDRGLSKAMRRLERLRERTQGLPLEQLRRGSTRLWFDFLLEFDPRAANQFIVGELRARPERPELWRLLSEANEAQGAIATAIELRKFLQACLPQAADARALVRLLAHTGRDAQAFEDALTGCLVQEDLTEPDVELQLARARFLLESGAEGWPDALALLGELWREHAEPHLLAPREEELLEDDESLAQLPLPTDPDAPALAAGPWQPGTPRDAVERALRICRLHARAIAWTGRPEEAATLARIARLFEQVGEDPLDVQVLSAQSALAPRPEQAQR